MGDAEAFARSRGSHFRDRFFAVAAPSEKLRVLFVSPYPILPPLHGGAVFMLQTVRELAKRCELHAIVLIDEPSQAAANRELEQICSSVEVMVRPRNSTPLSAQPHAVEEFASRDVRWLIDRAVFLHRIDIVQVEYTAMGQYIESYGRIVTALFEHDVYFQSIARTAQFFQSPAARWKARFEYLRALRYELRLLPRCDQVQVCTEENRRFLISFEPRLASRVQAGLRAAIDTAAYAFPGGPREPGSILFVGSSRHKPNLFAIEWFVAKVFPHVLAVCPEARLYLAGFDALVHPALASQAQIEMLGFVEDVQHWLRRCAVFVCPVLSGSGVRVKLLEAFASGIPVVSTRIGSEGLAREDGRICALADDPLEFARRVLDFLNPTTPASDMTARARDEVERNWDSAIVTERLERSYRASLAAKNA